MDGSKFWRIGDYPALLQKGIRRAIRLGMGPHDWRNPSVLGYWFAYYAHNFDPALYPYRDAAYAFEDSRRAARCFPGAC